MVKTVFNGCNMRRCDYSRTDKGTGNLKTRGIKVKKGKKVRQTKDSVCQIGKTVRIFIIYLRSRTCAKKLVHLFSLSIYPECL